MSRGLGDVYKRQPWEAKRSKLGFRANSRQVRPPNSSRGQPEAPSKIRTQYFTLNIIDQEAHFTKLIRISPHFDLFFQQML